MIYTRKSTNEDVVAVVVGPSPIGDSHIHIHYRLAPDKGELEWAKCPIHLISEARCRSPSRSPSPGSPDPLRRPPSPAEPRTRSRSYSPRSVSRPGPPRPASLSHRSVSPPGLPEPPSSNDRAASPPGPSKQYPPGWEMRRTASGLPYFVHHPTKTTSRTPPDTLPSYEPSTTPQQGKKKPAVAQPTLRRFFSQKSIVGTSTLEDTSPAVGVDGEPVEEVDCGKVGVGNKRRRSREDILANPKRHHSEAAEKLRVLQYADEYGVRCAKRKFSHIIKSASSISGWAKNKAQLEKKAHACGGHVQTLHPGKKSQFHATEGKLRRRLLQRRRHHIAVTKKMMMRWATCMDARLKAMSDGQRADWWVAFRKRRRISTRRVSSYRRANAETIAHLVRRYRANLHRGVRRGEITVLCNGDETCVSTEPCPKTTLHVKGGKSRVVVRVRGNLHTNFTVYLSFCIHLSIAPDVDGDPSVALGKVVRFKPVCLHPGSVTGKIQRELDACRRRGAFSRVEHTVTRKGKTDEASMCFIIKQTFRPEVANGQRCLYTVDGAPSHLHPSVCKELRKRNASLYVSPPACTPYTQAFDKKEVNTAFGTTLEDKYAEFVDKEVIGRKRRGPVPTLFLRLNKEVVGDDYLLP